jgi:excisionase family DNA binding protein
MEAAVPVKSAGAIPVRARPDLQTESEDPYLSVKEAADLIGITPKTLDHWRATRRHDIRFYKFGRRIAYKRSDVVAWMDQCAVVA